MPTYDVIATVRMTVRGLTKQVACDAAKLRIASAGGAHIRGAEADIAEIEIEMNERTDEA